MNNNTGKTALALLTGLAAGAALGILFAPRSGKETRAAIRSKGEDMKEDLDERIEQARKEWSKAKGKMADAASMTKDEVSELIHHLFNKGKQTATRVKEEVSTAANEMADKAKRTAEEQQRTARSN
ncbi:MAG: YtxH domain-containing protein [Flavobacteriales bacterium]|jgi:gas vesicle protein|nr:YtxH domain-containing protein [Flavobacteriales bacterium]MBK9539043.1 YtxH domain-containing protein [Flavobacteriales bacterium]